MGWETKPEWPKDNWPMTNEQWLKQTEVVTVGVDLASEPDKTIYSVIDDGKYSNISEEEFKKLVISQATINEKVLNNKIPTHDPYTNPNAFLYYECECGKKLDPQTKRFAELNNRASDAGWKIRWGAHSYIPYCVECAKEKGIE
jgi:hypothetical protein